MSAFSALGITDMKSFLADARAVVRWNVPLAFSWMDEASARLASYDEIEEYNKSVTSINTYLDSLEKMRYYDKQEVWGSLAPTRLEQI